MKEHLQLYEIDMKYVRDLAKADDNVMSVSPQLGKERRPFVGIVVLVNSKKYCVPLSSPKAKFQNKKNAIDFMRILDENDKDEHGMGKIIGALNFNNMLPVENPVLKPLNIRIKQSDNEQVKYYKTLLTKQLDWCQKNEKKLISHANRTYEAVTMYPEKSRNLTRRCCNFKKLEEVLAKYTMKTNKNNPDNYYILIENEGQLDKLRNSNIPFKINKDKTVIIVNVSDKEKAKKCLADLQSNQNQHKPKL